MWHDGGLGNFYRSMRGVGSVGNYPVGRKEAMTRDESDIVAGNLAADIIDLIQTKVIQLHKEGKITSSEGVYIGTSTCARCAAVLIGGQMPISHAASLDKLIDSFSKMFASETRTVFEHRLATEQQKGGKSLQQEGKSAWDA